MSRHLFSASGAERADACIASCFLPRASQTSAYSTKGTGVHAFLRAARVKGREEALAEIPMDAEHRRFSEVIPLEQMPQGGRAEVAYAWNVVTDTARVLGENICREYLKHGWNPALEIPVTVDLDGVLDSVAMIWDWKSGFQSCGDPFKSKQLRIQALAVCRARGLSSAVVAFGYLNERGEYAEDVAEFCALDLDNIADELRSLVRRVQAGADRYEKGITPNVSMGPWCDMCSCVPHCPGQVALAGALVNYKPPTGPLTTAKAEEAWALIQRMKPILENAEAGLREFAKTTPFRVPGGKVLKLVDFPYTEVDMSVAHKVLGDIWGPAVADAAVKKEITQAGIEKAIRDSARAKGTPLNLAKREVMEAIGRAKGLAKGTRPQVRQVKDPDATTTKTSVVVENGAPLVIQEEAAAL